MVNDNFPYESNAHLALSYQLLCLLKWLVENDKGTLKMIMEDALEQGALENLKRINLQNEDPETVLEMQDTIIDFFGLLESYLQETINDRAHQKIKAKALMPTLEHLDGTLYDNDSLQTSVESTASRIDKNPHKNPKQLLYETLLEQWEPTTETAQN